eukprot:TRINITY_DN8447_c0_g6_i1.p1 TRINITY_DN8447_c0_g6~~TRINITY_DN8447_c0_g6_i1.p1  ORF type:complete len:347 (+),score=71.03 TRINITY_DN8447_c0_g6_i1:1768-2808(+)
MAPLRWMAYVLLSGAVLHLLSVALLARDAGPPLTPIPVNPVPVTPAPSTPKPPPKAKAKPKAPAQMPQYKVDLRERLTRCLALTLDEGAVRKKSVWVMWVGDRNMHNAYMTYTNMLHSAAHASDRLGGKRSIVDRHADDEFFAKLSVGVQVRASFRNLHRFDKLAWMFEHPHSMMQMGKDADIDSAVAEDLGAHASQYARWAHAGGDAVRLPMKAPAAFDAYAERMPDAIILTEGRGGIPTAEQLDATLEIFANATTAVMWSPFYFTSRTPERHDAYQPWFASPRSNGSNYVGVDLWDMAGELPPMKLTGDTLNTSPYMKDALTRWIDALCTLERERLRRAQQPVP